MTLEASIRLNIEGYDGELRVGSWQGSEPVGELPRYELVAQAVDGTGRSTVLDVEELLGAPATLELPDQVAERSIHGVVESIEELADAIGGYRVTLVPRAVLLTDIVDHRVFLGKDAVEITRQIFDEQGLDLDVRVSRSLAKRPQTVQAFESSWAFVTRLCAEEGILWHLEHDTGRDVVVLSSEAAYKPLAGGEALVYSEGAPAGLVGGEAVYALELVHERAVGKVTLCDFDFEKADLDLTVSAGDGPLESFEYGAGYTDPGVGRELAAARLGLAQAKAVVLRGRSNSRRLAAGRTMALTGAPRDDLNGRWLIVALEHEGRDHGGSSAADGDRPRYEARFVAVPADEAYRPSRGEREARFASLGGVQNATITGPSGQEIHTEEHGRTKALLRWDRRGSSDDHASHWIRTMQPPTSGGMFLPRIGWEVLLGHLGRSADEPYVLGRIYNGQAVPPEGLPAKKVVTAFGTSTTPGGGSGNQLRIDDTAGGEGMLLAASAAYDERTENDKRTGVKGTSVHSVGGDHTHAVGIVHDVTVQGAQIYTVGGNREVTTTGNYSIQTASETVLVGGTRKFQVGGDYQTKASVLSRSVGGAKAVIAIEEANRHVTGSTLVSVGGAWNETGGLGSALGVLGASTLAVGGPMSIEAPKISLEASLLSEQYASRSVTAAGKRVESFGGAAKYLVGGSMSLKGSNVYFKATGKIVLQGPGATITITPGAIDIKGTFDSGQASVVTGPEVVG